tara:strand:- start:838 stop:2553 length:1716 start_codon:yes stop_codon:yes gene_type:complete
MASSLTREQVVDRITELLITSADTIYSGTNIETLQQYVSNGQVTQGDSSGKRVLYQYDNKAYEGELLLIDDILSITELTDVGQILFNPDTRIIEIKLDATNWEYYNLMDTSYSEFLDNVNQFVPLTSASIDIDPDKAKDVFDTTIYELLPDQGTKQDKINDFFSEYQILKGSAGLDTYPQQELQDVDDDGTLDVVDSNSELYDPTHDISEFNPEGYIPRQNPDNNTDVNFNQSLEWLRDDLNLYFPDQDLETEVLELPEAESISEGYLKIRNMNQAIIVRKEGDEDIGLMKRKEVIVGSPFYNANNGASGWNDTYAYTGGELIPSYLHDGFTVTMWVRFLDKVNSGTLFNFGNPTRQENPFGFRLETYIINKDDEVGVNYFTNQSATDTYGEVFDNYNSLGITYDGELTSVGADFFEDSDYERFVRLVVREQDEDGYPGFLRGSHVGAPWHERHRGVPEFNWEGGTVETTATNVINSATSYDYSSATGLFTNTRLPIDFGEWYFITATYNPTIIEDVANDPGLSYNMTPDFWRGNINGDGSYTPYSGLGARCKVEIISKSNLLRARGYRTS